MKDYKYNFELNKQFIQANIHVSFHMIKDQ